MPYALVSMELKNESACQLHFYTYNGDKTSSYDEAHHFEKRLPILQISTGYSRCFPKLSWKRLRIGLGGDRSDYELKNMLVYDELFQYKSLSPAQIRDSFPKVQHLEPSMSEYGSLKLQILAGMPIFQGDTWQYDKKINRTVLALELLLFVVLLCWGRSAVRSAWSQAGEKAAQVMKLHACFTADTEFREVL